MVVPIALELVAAEVVPARCRNTCTSLVNLGLVMSRGTRYGPHSAAHRRCSSSPWWWRSWWWEDGVRFSASSSRIFGWISTPWGPPTAALDWPWPALPVQDARAFLEACAMGLLRKGEKKVGGGPDPLVVAGDPLVLAYPVLWAFLTDRTWDDGSVREPGSLLVFEQDGIIKGMLRDKNDATCLWV